MPPATIFRAASLLRAADAAIVMPALIIYFRRCHDAMIIFHAMRCHAATPLPPRYYAAFHYFRRFSITLAMLPF